MEKNLTTGSVTKNIIIFSLPYLLSYFLQTLYGMADLFIVGRFDSIAGTSAVSIGSQVMHMLTVMIVGLAMGSTVGIAKAVGANDKSKVSILIGNTVTLFMTVSAVAAVILLIFTRSIVGIMSTPQEAVNGTVSYLTICFIGIPSITAYNIISSVLRGMGDSKTPIYFIAVACITNIILDYVFIGAFKMGATGAALGTTLSQAVSVCVALPILKKNEIRVSKQDFKPRRAVISELLKTGVPISAQDGLIQVAFILITVIANRRGLNDAAAVGIVEKIIGFVFLVHSSMLSAVSALGAQNIGAGKNKRAEQTLLCALVITVTFGLASAVILQFFAEDAVSLFTNDGKAVVVSGGQYLRGYAWDCVFAGIHFSFSGYFCACGKSYLSFLHNIAAIVFVRVPGAYIMSQIFPQTLFPMGLATAAGSLLSAIICIIAFIIIKEKAKCPN